MTADRYPLNLIPADPAQPAQDPDKWLLQRPFSEHDRSFEAEARLFVPGAALATAMNTALAVGEPLLLTGEPGTGKTQAAYYAAHKLGTAVFHFQVNSETTARDLLYHFDTVQYFHDAHLQELRRRGEPETQGQGPLDKRIYHHIRFEPQILERAVAMRRDQFEPLPDDLIALAIRCFLRLRERADLRKPPATGELLVWLRVLALALQTCPEELDRLALDELDALPYLHVLLKDHRDQQGRAE